MDETIQRKESQEIQTGIWGQRDRALGLTDILSSGTYFCTLHYFLGYYYLPLPTFKMSAYQMNSPASTLFILTNK